MKIIKIIASVFLITSLASAHDHDNLFDLCAVTGCVACDPASKTDEPGVSRAIGVWLQPTYKDFSLGELEGAFKGFQVGHEGERSEKQGLGVDHTEFYWSGTKANQLRGSAVIAIAEHDGETEVEFEEAYIETLNSYSLPEGFNIKLGRAFWTLGSLNAQHSHSDSFADRALPYRVFLEKAYNDDGAELSFQLPVDIYAVAGIGSFRGNDFPFGLAEGAESGNEAKSAYIRVGDSIGENASWRVGAYMLSGNVGSRASGHAHDGVTETLTFSGDSDLYIYDVRYAFAPTGNSAEKELVLSAEYFSRNEDGILNLYVDNPNEPGYVDTATSAESDDFAWSDIDSSGYYASAVYKINPKMRVGYRYSKMNSPDVPSAFAAAHEGEFDPAGFDPVATAYMIDWNHSDHSLIRFQINQEELANGQEDDQFIVQYIMNL